MAARYPRRQAARVAGLLTKSLSPALTLVEGRPRSGRSDFLWQLFEALRQAAGPLPAYLPAGAHPLDGAVARVMAQLLAFADGRLRSPFAAFDRDALLDRPDLPAWQPLLAACDGPFCADRLLAALCLLAEERGPVCLLVDDAPPELLTAAAALESPAVAVIAAANARPPAAARLLPLEPFSTREALLLAETLARSLDVPFSGAAAEPFAACMEGDAFVLDTIVHAAAMRGEPLDSEKAFIRAYSRECAGGTLAGYFGQRVPGRPGSAARRFAIELLAALGPEAPPSGEAVREGSNWLAPEAWLDRRRHRAPVDEVLEAFAELGWAGACARGWLVRSWPAAQHWALMQTLDPLAARGVVSAQLAARAGSAAARAVAAERRERIRKSLLAMTPAPGVGQAFAPLVSPLNTATGEEACPTGSAPRAGTNVGECLAATYEVTSEALDGADLFVCFGLTAESAAHTAPVPALLAIALMTEGGKVDDLLPQAEKRLADAAAALAGVEKQRRCIEKWLVTDSAVPAEARVTRNQAPGLGLPRRISNEPVQPVEEAGSLLGSALSAFNQQLARRGEAQWKRLGFERFNEWIAGAQCAMNVNASTEMALSLPAEPEIELAAVKLLDHVAERQSWDAEFLSRARMALVEACLNAVKQARAQTSAERRRIEVRIATDRRELIMRVYNPGAPFDPDASESGGAALGSGVHRGHGLKIIRSFVDEVRFFADLRGTCIEMRKRAEAPAKA